MYADATVRLTTRVHSDESFEDPATGQIVNDITIQNPEEHLSISAGYSYSGEPIVSTVFTDGADPSGTVADQVTSIRLQGNLVAYLNSYGQVIGATAPEEAGTESPMNLLGDMTGASVTNNIVIEVSGDNSPDPSSTLSGREGRISPSFTRSADPSGNASFSPIVRFLGADTLEIIDVGREGANAALPSITQSRRFHKDKSNWVLHELRMQSEDVDAHRRIAYESVMTLSNVRWTKNAALDAARRRKRPTNRVIPVGSSAPGLGLPSRSVPSRPSFIIEPCEGPDCPPPPPPGGGTGGGGSTWDPGPDIGGCFVYGGIFYDHYPRPPYDVQHGGYPAPAVNVAGNVHPDGVNLVLQHGLVSSAATWCDLEHQLRESMRIGFETRFSLSSLSSFHDQGADLLARLNSVRGGNGQFIFVGHSNGGIVSREVAHTVGGDPALIRGVLTIDSPHRGAPIAQVNRQAAAIILAPLTGVAGCTFVSHQLCNMLRGSPLQTVAGVVLPLALNATAPVVRELHPRSSFFASFNSVPESFPRGAIQSKSWDKWTEWRLYGDLKCHPYFSCGGRSTVKFIDRSYHSAIKCAVVGGLAGFFWAPAWGVAAGCAKIGAQLKGYDLVFKRLTVGNDSGDGIVPLNSQFYPNVPSNQQFTILDGDSHVGVLRGVDKSGPRTAQAMNELFLVPLRQ